MPRKSSAPQKEPTVRYFLLDKDVTHLPLGPNGRELPVTAQQRKEGFDMTEAQAMYFVASGTIGTVNPEESPAVQDQVKVNAGRVPERDDDDKSGRKRS